MGIHFGLRVLGLYLFLTSVSGGIFVPDEVASLISIAYSNIPPTKIGTDSRVGFGFRLGPNADGQVLFELGPQRDTQALGTESEKRETKIDLKERVDRIKNANNQIKDNSIISDATRNANMEKLVAALTKWLQGVSQQRNLTDLLSTNTTETRTRVMKSSP